MVAPLSHLDGKGQPWFASACRLTANLLTGCNYRHSLLWRGAGTLNIMWGGSFLCAFLLFVLWFHSFYRWQLSLFHPPATPRRWRKKLKLRLLPSKPLSALSQPQISNSSLIDPVVV